MNGLGREPELDAVLKYAPPVPWAEAARAIACGDPVQAATILERIGYRPGEAYTRLRAAESLADGGRRGEADAQLALALDFYRSVGATRYIKEGARRYSQSERS